MVFAFSSRQRDDFEDKRVTLFESEKTDTFIYEYNKMYYVALVWMYGVSEFRYNTLKELFDDAEEREFFEPMELTPDDCERLYKLKSDKSYTN